MSFPLTIPSNLKVINSRFRLVYSVGISTSPFTYAQQTTKNQGERWEGDVTLRPYDRSGAAAIQSFLARLQGVNGTFLYGDPDYLALGARGTPTGTPVVDGGSQTGTSLNIRGLSAFVTNAYRAGDYIQLGTSGDSKLYMVTDDVDSDSSGNATINIAPKLKSSPSDGDTIIHTGAKGVFRLSNNAIEWASDRSSVYSIAFSFVEAINV